MNATYSGLIVCTTSCILKNLLIILERHFLDKYSVGVNLNMGITADRNKDERGNL